MLPFLAMSHLLPFAHLSNILAQRGGIRVTFISTPRNLTRIHPSLSPAVNRLTFPFPSSAPDIPDHAECNIDVPPNKRHLINKAFDLLQQPVARFLEEAKPDWVVFDYLTYWLPPIAARLGISSAFFSTSTAAMLGFQGPPEALLRFPKRDALSTADASIENTIKKKSAWIPFETNVRMRVFELRKFAQIMPPHEEEEDDTAGLNDTVRFGMALTGSDVILFRSSPELEPEWFDLVSDLYKKPIIPLGLIPPAPSPGVDSLSGSTTEPTCAIFDWLSEQKVGSVVYVALGTEVEPSQDEIAQLALGLEQCGLPLFWVLRKSPWTGQAPLDMLPPGYLDRVRERAMLWTGWAPQVKVLGHDSVGGFVTHCGWSSVVEGLSFGRSLILLPFLYDQGVNARLLEEKKLGVEIARDEFDGRFTSDAVAESIRVAMVEEGGKCVTENVCKMKEMLADGAINDKYIDEFVQQLSRM
uniref:Glycosyltransferase n=1 Tax=Kalanchoe fedtschenkoi TaxID=63787 RepID=A0A7N0T257_KALFE